MLRIYESFNATTQETVFNVVNDISGNMFADAETVASFKDVNDAIYFAESQTKLAEKEK